MGWFWATATEAPALKYAPAAASTKSTGASACPIDHLKLPDACPVKHRGGTTTNGATMSNEVWNPLNNMPMELSSETIPGQKIKLSDQRTILTIPRGELEGEGLWEYPLPQQMLTAMYRKGKGEGIDETAVELMVEVHNFLNEGAWQQILQWEAPYTATTKVEPRLLKFTGRPQDLSPRAQMFLTLGKWFPSYFLSQPPFDRHDWTVLRSKGKDQGWDQVRYVIDYYAAPDDEETGMPAFMLDTRPALDSFGAASDRFGAWAGPLWKKAMGEAEYHQPQIEPHQQIQLTK